MKPRETYIRCPHPTMRSVIFCVTNDLFFDRRMQKICSSLQTGGYEISLVGRRATTHLQDTVPSYRRYWLHIIFQKGPLFYLEFQIRLFFFLLFQPKAILCAIDLDTMPAVYLASIAKSTQRILDAHELFTEQKEVISRKWVHRCWLWLEKWLIPRFPLGYTVNEALAEEFFKRYGVRYTVIRNVPVWISNISESTSKRDRWIIYQGAVNEGRSFETLIPAMKKVPVPLHIYGTGNFLIRVKELIQKEELQDKIICHPPELPENLVLITPLATIGVTLFENKGLNQYLSLANRFFDYIMAGIPQICANYPAYEAILDRYPVGLSVDPSDSEAIAEALNKLLTDDVVYEKCKRACWEAREEFNWEKEQQHLLDFYAKLP